MRFTCLILLLFLQFFYSSQNYNVNDDLLFSFNWNNVDLPKNLENKDMFSLTTPDKENFTCVVEKQLHSKSESFEDEYNGPGEWKLLEPLLQSDHCSIRLDSYWAYELCHRKHLRQYHESNYGEKGSNKQQYFLGFNTPYSNSLSTVHQGRSTVSLEGRDYPYFKITFIGGDLCDLTGIKRSTNVLYVCNEDSFADMYSVTEVESCKYEVVVLTRFLCKHPKYRIKKNYINVINMFPKSKDDPAIPLALSAFKKEREDLEKRKQITLEGLFGNSKFSNIRVEASRNKDAIIYRIRTLPKKGDSQEEDKSKDFEEMPLDEQIDDLIKDLENSAEESASEKPNVASKLMDLSQLLKEKVNSHFQEDLSPVSSDEVKEESQELDSPSSSDAKPKKDDSVPSGKSSEVPESTAQNSFNAAMFLAGKQCLKHGLQGEMYTICHKQKITQQIENRGDSSVNVQSFGSYEEEHQLKMHQILKTPQSRNQRHFYYSDGSVCNKDEKFSSEVILKCTNEPKLVKVIVKPLKSCFLEIYLESSEFCKYIAKMDRFGHLPPGL